MNIPKPPIAYKKLQERKHSLMSNQTRENFCERKELHEQMVGLFSEAFGFQPDKGKVAFRFHTRNAGFFGGLFFDHATRLRRGENVVLIGQPYGYDKKKFFDLIEGAGGKASEATSWAFYYPGHEQSVLLIAEFTPAAAAAIDEARREK